ncbi:MAG TPA: class I SAM-dependent methyltransferase [Actinomycetota bacterium]|nr:class I SAM-dependent methyltransferase [Actinomycetota bacterium]
MVRSPPLRGVLPGISNVTSAAEGCPGPTRSEQLDRLDQRAPGRTRLKAAGAAALSAAVGRLPARYQVPWQHDFKALVTQRLRPGAVVLDVGSGRTPAIPASDRPAGCTYVGLDISAQELQQAPPGSYDEIVVSDITSPHPELAERFDLVLSWQALEHVKPMRAALDNLYGYLKPGGELVAQFSGTFSVHAIANRVVPRPVSMWLLERLLKRPPDTVFHAYYDGCWYSSVRSMLSAWSRVDVEPVWLGAGYFTFFPPLAGVYVAYEEWARLSGHRNLAPYYLVQAVR